MWPWAGDRDPSFPGLSKSLAHLPGTFWDSGPATTLPHHHTSLTYSPPCAATIVLPHPTCHHHSCTDPHLAYPPPTTPADVPCNFCSLPHTPTLTPPPLSCPLGQCVSQWKEGELWMHTHADLSSTCHGLLVPYFGFGRKERFPVFGFLDFLFPGGTYVNATSTTPSSCLCLPATSLPSFSYPLSQPVLSSFFSPPLSCAPHHCTGGFSAGRQEDRHLGRGTLAFLPRRTIFAPSLPAPAGGIQNCHLLPCAFLWEEEKTLIGWVFNFAFHASSCKGRLPPKHSLRA